MEFLSDHQFKNLPRYENGRIKCFPDVAFILTDAQILELHGDDWSYLMDLKEEMEYELSLLAAY